VFVSATLGASAVYVVAKPLARTRLVAWVIRDRRVAAVRRAVAGEGAWVQFLLRLSPIVPYVLLNYALGLSRVRFRDFLIACTGMIPAIVMYTYYGKVVGDVREGLNTIFFSASALPRRVPPAWRSRVRPGGQSRSSASCALIYNPLSLTATR
jgi:uncharacterized membrane protein YdjX (TVP38/TMEM64 family)